MSVKITGSPAATPAVKRLYRFDLRDYPRAFMENSRRRINGVVILADESAEWVVAGLPQLDRLGLALNEYFDGSNRSELVPVCVHWTNAERVAQLRQNRQFPQLSVTNDVHQFPGRLTGNDGDVLVVTTRLVINRTGFPKILGDRSGEERLPILFAPAEKIFSVTGVASRLLERPPALDSRLGSSKHGFYLHNPGEIAAAEKWLLASTGKSQDGFIARFVNRPISRMVSRILLRFPITPNQWTIAATVIPIAGGIFLIRGDRLGFVIGAILFQLQSALDGCDGEIARLKYLESQKGIKLDGLCDRLATMLLAIGLGIGLSRQVGIAHQLGSFYRWEGILAALLIGITETILQRNSIADLQPENSEKNLSPNYVSSHRRNFNPTDQLKVWAIKNSGMLVLGERVTSFFVQATKRDVFNLAFVLMILAGWPQWPLHILAVSAVVIAILALPSVVGFIRAGSRHAQLASAKKKSAV